MTPSLEGLKSRILSLRDTLDKFTIEPNLQYNDIIDKMNILMVKLNAIQVEKNILLQPYSLRTNAEIIPNVFLRTRFIPEIERELTDDTLTKNSDGKKHNDFVRECIDHVEELRNDFKSDVRCEAEIEEDFDELAKEEDETLKRMLRVWSTGIKTRPEDLLSE